MLVRGVQGVRYQIYAVLAHPYLSNRYEIPKSVPVLRVPMWGTEQPSEHLDLPFSVVYERRLRTTDAVLRQEFLPLFDEVQHAIWSPQTNGRRHGQVLHSLYQWFRDYDYQEAMKSTQVWDFYTEGLRTDRWTKLAGMPTLADSVQAMGWLYRFLVILNTPVPKADVTHASAAAFSGLPGVLAKLESKTPYVLTEHGVYLREQYLAVGRSNMSPFSKQFLMGLVRSTATVNYAYADIVAPVAAFNARWERRYGVAEDKIKVIYNGVDPGTFQPRPRPVGAPLTVVAVARIDPLKDILTLLRAAAKVCQQIPQVKFVVYGGVSVPDYYQECLALQQELGLEESFVFAGHVSDVASAYASGDVVVLSSISEGFPYSVVEAMMCGRAVVATDVGGTREACAGAGLLVEPRNPTGMAEAILRLLKEPALRTSMAEEARERALAYFTIERNLQLYRDTYASLAARYAPTIQLPELVARRRLLALDRARVLQATGHYAEAIPEYRLAADLDPAGPATPALLLTIAELYLSQGDIRNSWREMERAEALATAIEQQRAG
jgi:glycosyltransferase involved in cell wall biosynthesis